MVKLREKNSNFCVFYIISYVAGLPYTLFTETTMKKAMFMDGWNIFSTMTVHGWCGGVGGGTGGGVGGIYAGEGVKNHAWIWFRVNATAVGGWIRVKIHANEID